MAQPKTQQATIEQLINFIPGVTDPKRVYDVLSTIAPKNPVDLSYIYVFLEIILDYAFNQQYNLEIAPIFAAIAQNIHLYPLYYQLNLTNINRLKLDPKTEQIIDFFNSLKQNQD